MSERAWASGGRGRAFGRVPLDAQGNPRRCPGAAPPAARSLDRHPPLYTQSILPFGTTGDQRCCERCQNSGRARHGRGMGAARAEHWRSAGAARAHHGRGPGRWRRAPSGRWTRAQPRARTVRAQAPCGRPCTRAGRARAECAGQASGAARPSDARWSTPSPSTTKATPVHRPDASARHAARRSAGSAEQPVFGLSARAAGSKS